MTTASSTGKVRDLAALDEFVSDGSSIFVGGFTVHRVPMALVREVIRHGPRNLTVWSHIGGVAIEFLVAAGLVDVVRSSYVGFDILGPAPHFRDSLRDGSLTYIEETEATLMFGMKATQYRLPFMPTRALVGSEIVVARDDLQEYDCPLSGERLVAVPPVSADVALVHAQAADSAGNLALYGTVGNDVEIIKVSRRVVASVERVVSSAELARRPEQVLVPGHLVDVVIEVPGGAAPTSCLPAYRADLGALLDYLHAAEEGRTAAYLRNWVARGAAS